MISNFNTKKGIDMFDRKVGTKTTEKLLKTAKNYWKMSIITLLNHFEEAVMTWIFHVNDKTFKSRKSNKENLLKK